MQRNHNSSLRDLKESTHLDQSLSKLLIKMQRKKCLQVFAVLLVVLVLDVPRISAYKHNARKQGKTTTKSPPPTQAPPTNAPPAAQPAQAPVHTQPPPPYQAAAPQQPHPYDSQPGQNFHPPGPPSAPQPVIINHVQQPQSSGGLGTAGGLAIGKLKY